MPRSSVRSAALNERTKALVAAYTASYGRGCIPAVEATLMIPPRPRSTIPGTKARVRTTTASQFSRTCCASCSGSSSQKRPHVPKPALFTRRSTGSPSSSTFCTTARRIRRQVALDHVRRSGELLRQFVEPVAPACDQDELVAAPRERARELGADPGRGARDECNARGHPPIVSRYHRTRERRLREPNYQGLTRPSPRALEISERTFPMQVQLYDTTLRDGMQGEGMSLSADEKLRVAHALDGLGVHFIEAGFPSSNPKEEALFELLAGETLRERRDRRVRDDPAARRERRPGSRRCGCSPSCFAPVCTLVGKTWALHLEKVTRVDPEENLRMIEDSVRFLRDAGQARGLRRRALLRRLPRRRRLRRCAACARRSTAGAENVTLCDTNGSSLPAQVAAATERVVARAGRARGGRHPHPRRRRLRRGELAGGGGGGARLVQGTMNGYGERCGNANLVSILPALQLKMGYECVPPERLARADGDRAPRRRDLQRHARPEPALRGRNAFAHKGGMHVAGVNADARTFEHVDPEARRQRPRGADLRAVGQGHRAHARRAARPRARRGRRGPRRRARQGARARRLPLRGRRRLLRPAHPARRRATTSRSSGSSPGA